MLDDGQLARLRGGSLENVAVRLRKLALRPGCGDKDSEPGEHRPAGRDHERDPWPIHGQAAAGKRVAGGMLRSVIPTVASHAQIRACVTIAPGSVALTTI